MRSLLLLLSFSLIFCNNCSAACATSDDNLDSISGGNSVSVEGRSNPSSFGSLLCTGTPSVLRYVQTLLPELPVDSVLVRHKLQKLWILHRSHVRLDMRFVILIGKSFYRLSIYKIHVFCNRVFGRKSSVSGTSVSGSLIPSASSICRCNAGKS